MDAAITFTLNGQKRTVNTDPQRPLLDVLREDLKLTGTKYGCGEKECGACSVLLDGKRVFSCRTAAIRASGKTLLTIEGLSSGDKLHPVQQAFLDQEAFQCGYCTPGMIMAAVELLAQTAAPTDQQIVEHMDGNICRCCSYPAILQAVRRAVGPLSR